MKRTFICAGLLLALSACSNQQESTQPFEVWNNSEKSTLNTKQVAENQSLVVLYRKNNVKGSAVNVYINGDYQASLRPNAYSFATVCATKNLFTLSFSSNTAFGNRTQGVHYTLPVNETTYVKVNQDPNGKLNFTRVDKAIAEQDIASLSKEKKILSRVKTPQNCDTPVLANTENQPLVTYCANLTGKEKEACSQPNRRVDIIAYGNK